MLVYLTIVLFKRIFAWFRSVLNQSSAKLQLLCSVLLGRQNNAKMIFIIHLIAFRNYRYSVCRASTQNPKNTKFQQGCEKIQIYQLNYHYEQVTPVNPKTALLCWSQSSIDTVHGIFKIDYISQLSCRVLLIKYACY